MSYRIPVTLLAGLFLACTPDGSEGGRCVFEGGIFDGHWTCDEGLVCNEALEPERCERPNTHPNGDPCARDANCAAGLWCPPGDVRTCDDLLQEGEPCPAGLGCAAGLACVKDGDSITCVRPG